jgi:hypothetical protein
MTLKRHMVCQSVECPTYGGELRVFFDTLQGYVNTIPVDYRTKAQIEFRLEGGYYDDPGDPVYDIYYDRPETAEETSARRRKEYRDKAIQKERKRQQYEALKKEFEG